MIQLGTWSVKRSKICQGVMPLNKQMFMVHVLSNAEICLLNQGRNNTYGNDFT